MLAQPVIFNTRTANRMQCLHNQFSIRATNEGPDPLRLKIR